MLPSASATGPLDGYTRLLWTWGSLSAMHGLSRLGASVRGYWSPRRFAVPCADVTFDVLTCVTAVAFGAGLWVSGVRAFVAGFAAGVCLLVGLCFAVRNILPSGGSKGY